jgi:hypothetical protein
MELVHHSKRHQLKTVSEWLLFGANISATVWREQVNFQWYDDEVCFVLDKHDVLDLPPPFFPPKKQQILVHKS